MDTNIFKSKFEAAVANAKASKASGTQISCKIYMKSGIIHQFQQYNGSWWKYSIDDDAMTLQIGNRSSTEAADATADNMQYKSVRIIAISEIAAFDIDYMTVPETTTTTTATTPK